MTIVVILLAIAGLAFGSFLNVCITRLPLGESILWPGSHCRNCRRMLRWYMNVPLVSWLVLRGKCAYCKKPVPARYPLVELGTALLWAAVWLEWQPVAEAYLLTPGYLNTEPHPWLVLLAPVLNAIFVSTLFALAFMDWESMFLSDWFTLTGAAVGLLWAAFSPHILSSDAALPWPHVVMHLCTSALFVGLFAALSGIYWLVRKQHGMGFGDIKLAAMLGAWLNWDQILVTLVLAVLGAMLFAPFVAIRQQRWKRYFGQISVPFGSFLALAGLASYFWGDAIWTRYLQLWGLG